MKKRVFRKFRYTECDDFAAFLNKKAKEGWHFIGWKLGLIFEMGEPEDAEYVVDVFTKGSNMDTKPEKNTKEFAEYCEAAGWKFIDSYQKFCVFKKINDDADDIVTTEERFKNAGKEEVKNAFIGFIGQLIIALMYVPRFFMENFYYQIFDSTILLIVIGFLLTAFYYFGYFIKVSVWYYRTKKVLYIEKLYLGIGEEKQRKRYWRNVGFILIWEVVLIVTLAVTLELKSALYFLISLMLFVIGAYLIEYWRPSRSEHVLSIIAISFIAPVILVCLFLSGDSFEEKTYTDKTLVPFVQEDYKDTDYEFENVSFNIVSNIFGQFKDYNVTYYKFNENTNEREGDHIQYFIMESKYEWIIDHCWRTLTKDFDEYKDCSESWEAIDAFRDGEWIEFDYVRYENQIFMLKYEDKLTQEQIDIIREKAGLGQVM